MKTKNNLNVHHLVDIRQLKRVVTTVKLKHRAVYRHI